MHIGMHLQAAVDASECLEQCVREVAPLGESRVEAGRPMPFGQDEAISVLPVWSLWVDVHDVEVQGCQDIRLRQ